MRIAQILNVIAILFLAVSLLIMVPFLIYLSIGFLVASIIAWRIIANKRS